jgi:inorganic triphosphatase YgiF
LTRKTRRSLKPIFETRVRRTVYTVTVNGAEIEVSLDSGRVTNGDDSSAFFCEGYLP